MPHASSPTRRTALAGLLAVTVSGCGVHLEEDAPSIPLIPTRDPIPAESGLLELLTRTTELEKASARATSSRARTWAALHARQVEVIDSALRARGVPAAAIAAALSAALATATGPAPSVSTGELAAMEAATVADLHRLIGVVDAELVTVLASLAAQRSAAARRLKRTQTVSSTMPRRFPVEGVLPLLAATREAAYGLEVVAARSVKDQRDLAVATLARLRALVMDQEAIAGAAAPATPLAYSLPLAANDPDTRARLARHLLGSLVEAYAAGLDSLVADPTAVITASSWLADAVLLHQLWGGQPTPFPGLA